MQEYINGKALEPTPFLAPSGAEMPLKEVSKLAPAKQTVNWPALIISLIVAVVSVGATFWTTATTYERRMTILETKIEGLTQLNVIVSELKTLTNELKGLREDLVEEPQPQVKPTSRRRFRPTGRLEPKDLYTEGANQYMKVSRK